MRKIQQFVLAMQFLTRITLTKKNMPCEKEDFRGAMDFFTLIGLIIGAFQYGVYKLIIYATQQSTVAAFVAVLLGIFLTGGLHLDGLADVFDGFGAQTNREKTLEIMKDSRVGSFGAIALIVDILWHAIALTAFIEAPYKILLVHLTGKWMVVLICYTGLSATKGLGALWIQNIKLKGVLFNSLIFLAASFYLLGMKAMVLSIAAYATMAILRSKMTHKLGGITGDCLGAVQQLGEWVALLVLVLI